MAQLILNHTKKKSVIEGERKKIVPDLPLSRSIYQSIEVSSTRKVGKRDGEKQKSNKDQTI